MKALLVLLILLCTAAAQGTELIWRNPATVESLDFAAGVGGRGGVPQPPFTFHMEEPGGTAPKVIVTDARGRKWSVKWGEEVKAETFVSRLLWGTGYFAETTHFVAKGTIDSVGAISPRVEQFIDRAARGRFHDARFELRDNLELRMVPGKTWDLRSNPFEGKPEFNGLRLMIMLVSNWDIKGENMAIFELRDKTHMYGITDWGATMGRWGQIAGRSKWDCEGYTAQTPEFVRTIDEEGGIEFGYTGKETQPVVSGIRQSDIRWLMQYLGRISDTQLTAALNASGASPDETACFKAALRARIDALRKIGSASVSGIETRSRRSIRVLRRSGESRPVASDPAGTSSAPQSPPSRKE